MTNLPSLTNPLIDPLPVEPPVEGDVDVDIRQGIATTSVSPAKMAWRRYWRHRGAAVSTFVLGAMVLTVLASGVTARYGVNEQVLSISEGRNQYLTPRSIAWFGTDEIGRDVYSRLIYGLRVSMLIGFCSGVLSLLVGTVAGALAGLRGGFFDDALMRVTDIFLAFPFLVAVLVVRNLLGNVGWVTYLIGEQTSIRFLIVLFAIFGWMLVARIVRAQILSLKEREFIEAARALGASNTRIILRHLLPNSVGPLLVAFTISVVAAIVAESTLAFFGFGPQAGAGETSLGNLVELSKGAVYQGHWWLVVFPTGTLVLLALCINFIGDGLRDATDPKASRGRA